VPDPVWRILAGLLAAIVVAAAARRRRSLSKSGAVAAVAVGATVVGGGGWWWGLLVVVFFATASALSRRDRRDPAPAAGLTARGSERDAVQVLANGGVATLLAALAPLLPAAGRDELFAAFAGAVAAATADTWATELGRRSRAAPRLITTRRPVPPGASGGVTPLGTLASLAGAATIGGVAAAGAAAGWAPAVAWPLLLLATTLAGTAGAAFDSLLGATLQAAYHCPTCGLPTERRVHRCGTATRLVRGWPAVDNDAVNAAATLLGAALGAAVAAAAGL
jgi:uncharacterized protein (TIGR00297 family)